MQDRRLIYRYLVYVCLFFPMVTQECSYVKACAHLLNSFMKGFFFFLFFLQMSLQGLHTFVITGCELIEYCNSN